MKISMLKYDGVTYYNSTDTDLLRMGVPVDAINTAIVDAEWAKIRKQRDQNLTSSDWTQIADSPFSDADKTLWATYRQALRDLPDNAASPDAVVWPDQPSI